MNNKNSKYQSIKIYVFAFFVLQVISCGKSNYETVTIQKELPQFDMIKLVSVFDIYLLQDTVFLIEITGLSEYAENIVWELEGNELVIRNDSRLKFTKPSQNKIELYIHSDSLKRIKTNETCYIETINPIIANKFTLVFTSKINEAKLDLDCHSFYYMNYFPSGGKLELLGRCNYLKIWNIALMSVDAKYLLADSAIVKNSSKGICEVNVENKLEYSINGEGDIHLYGNPKQIVLGELTSTGRLVRRSAF